MGFNIKKYNIVICFTIVLICLTVVFSSVDFSSKLKEPTQLDAGSINADTEDPGIEGNDSSSANTNSLGMPKLGNLSNVGYLLNAIDMLEKYDYGLTVSSKIEGTSMSVTGTQYLKSYVYKCGDTSYVYTNADGSQIPMGYGETYKEYMKINDSEISIKRDGSSIKTQNLTSYLSTHGERPDKLPFILNSDTVKMTAKNNPSETYIELTLTLKPEAWKNYLLQLKANGGDGSNPKISSITLTLKINKTYGYLISVNSEENYNITRSGIAASTSATVNYSFKYSNDNTSSIEEINNQFK